METSRRAFVLGFTGVAGGLVISCGKDDGSVVKSGSGAASSKSVSGSADIGDTLGQLLGNWEVRSLSPQSLDDLAGAAPPDAPTPAETMAWWWLGGGSAADVSDAERREIDQLLLEQPDLEQASKRRAKFLAEVGDPEEGMTPVTLGEGTTLVKRGNPDAREISYKSGSDDVEASSELADGSKASELTISYKLTSGDGDGNDSRFDDYRVRYDVTHRDDVTTAQLKSVATVDESGDAPSVTPSHDQYCTWARLRVGEKGDLATLIVRMAPVIDYMGDQSRPDPAAADGIDCERFEYYEQEDWDTAPDSDSEDEQLCDQAASAVPHEAEFIMFLLQRV